MTHPALRHAFIALHLTLVLVALVDGAQTLHHAIGEWPEHNMLAVFGGMQLFAALLFLWPKTLRVSGVVLVVVFVHAALFHAVNGEFPGAPLVFAAAAFFVTIHGDAWRSHDLNMVARHPAH